MPDLPRSGHAGSAAQRPCRTLLCVSSGHGCGQCSVELAGDVALDRAADLAAGLALCGPARDIAAVRSQLRMRVRAMVCTARFSARSPPRLSRCRTVCPLLAGTGLVPASAAKAGSLRTRPTWEKDTTTCAALTGPTPGRSVSPGASWSTRSCSSRRLFLSTFAVSRMELASRRISPCRTA
jgi:hypothetical protein